MLLKFDFCSLVITIFRNYHLLARILSIFLKYEKIRKRIDSIRSLIISARCASGETAGIYVYVKSFLM